MIIPHDLEVGVKGQFDTCKRFTGDDILYAVFLFQSPRTNGKGDIRPF